MAGSGIWETNEKDVEEKGKAITKKHTFECLSQEARQGEKLGMEGKKRQRGKKKKRGQTLGPDRKNLGPQTAAKRGKRGCAGEEKEFEKNQIVRRSKESQCQRFSPGMDFTPISIKLKKSC